MSLDLYLLLIITFLFILFNYCVVELDHFVDCKVAFELNWKENDNSSTSQQ